MSLTSYNSETERKYSGGDSRALSHAQSSPHPLLTSPRPSKKTCGAFSTSAPAHQYVCRCCFEWVAARKNSKRALDAFVPQRVSGNQVWLQSS